MNDVAQPDELEKIGQFLVRTVKLQSMCSLGRGKLQSRKRIHSSQVGCHQP